LIRSGEAASAEELLVAHAVLHPESLDEIEGTSEQPPAGTRESKTDNTSVRVTMVTPRGILGPASQYRFLATIGYSATVSILSLHSQVVGEHQYLVLVGGLITDQSVECRLEFWDPVLVQQLFKVRFLRSFPYVCVDGFRESLYPG